MTTRQKELAKKKLADLQVQAMIFDMDIDIETWSLTPRQKHQEADWLTQWKEKVANGDNQPEFDVDLE